MSTSSAITISVRGASELTGLSVELRVPSGCVTTGAVGGDLLTRGGEVLALAGPRPDGVVLAAGAQTRGGVPVNGDGVALVIATSGPSCSDAPSLLRATSYDAQGAAHDIALAGTTLPGSGTGGLMLLAIASALLSRRLCRSSGTLSP